tara:strand:- start:100 stop:315 length:216 start_codon:yes stop_codon:yes gene_type:complete
MNTLYKPIVFIIENQPVKQAIHINLRLMPAIHMVLDPSQYNGNTTLIIGAGDVNVNTADPMTVTITENSSR